MEDGIEWFGEECDQRGWLLASPELHGKNSDGRYALAAVPSQHDVIDTLDYMVAHYNVDTSRIYLAGGSMGGMTAAVTAEKYPDRFAAVVEWSGPTDLETWYRIEMPDGKDLGHQPGQFVEVSIFGVGEAPFSISSSPTVIIPYPLRM